jgi:hypothetical protein
MLTQLGVTDRSDLVDQVNTKATDWARFRAAELVGMRRDEDGNLVPAPRAAYRIDDTTREQLRDVLTAGLEDNIGLDDLVDDIETSFAFSSERAELIARTEITRANNESGVLAAKEARDELGLGMKKGWLADDDPCDLCQENADEGFIDLDDEFPSGDNAPPGHPRCECTLIYEVDEDE